MTSVEDVAGMLVRGDQHPPRLGDVVAVNTDGTVSVALSRGEVNSLPALRAYSPRAVGDRVLVVDIAAGPVVVGAFGEPVGITVDNDAPPTGQGWEQVVVYTRNGELWGDRVVPIAPPAGTTVTVTASGLHVYRSGGWLRSGYAEQGDWVGMGLQTGLVAFPAGAFAALSGLTPTAGSIRVHRRNTDHGVNAATPLTLWRCLVSGVPDSTPARIAGSYPAGAPRRNETLLVPLTAAWLAPFTAGTANALLIYTETAAENVEIDSATLTITAV